MENQTTDMSVLQCHEWLHKKHPSVIILIRVGDFYETYDEDAVIVSKCCGTKTTKRTDHLLCGFPANSVNTISTMLGQAGFKVILFDYQDIVELIKQENNMKANNEVEMKSFNPDSFKFIGNESIQRSYYWFNDTTTKLEEVRIVSIICHLLSGSIIYNLMHCDIMRQVVAKKDYDSLFELKLYKNENDYISNRCVGVNYSLNEWKIKNALNGCFNYCNEGNGKKYFYSYIIKNGKPTEIALMDCINEVKISFGANGNDLLYSFDKKIDLSHFYHSKEELFKYESVCVADNNGKMHFTDAPMSTLRLTEEQQKILNNFLEARKALKAAGVKLIFTSDDWEMYAINGNKFEEIHSDEPSMEFGEYLNNGVLRIDELHGSMAIDFVHDAYFNGDCTSVLCKLKK